MEKHVTVIATKKTSKVRKQLHIHHDIAFSILSKLSIKPLKRFECVCKSWSFLSDNPYFMSHYRNSFLTKYHSYYDDASFLPLQRFPIFHNQRFELHSLYEERFPSNVKIDWPYLHCFPRMVGCGSVHGILCFSIVTQNDIILCNPSTKDYKAIPLDRNHHECYRRGYSNSGFGYDCVEDDYKVMCIYHLDNEPMEDLYLDPFIWEIFSLKNNSWKKLDVDIKCNPTFWNDEQLYIDGFSHRVCQIEEYDYKTYVLSFDWHREVFTTTLIPFNIEDILDFLYHWINLVLLNGSIALILNYTSTSTFHIFILGELGVKESWTKLCTLEHLPYLEHPIGMGKKSDMLFRKKDGGLVCFDLITQKTTDLSITNKACSNIVIHKQNPISLLAYVGKSI
ncbi:unnamed protein product [Lathyrus sativus]|nr:unnamed protein product [Lathyrus sativus]